MWGVVGGRNALGCTGEHAAAPPEVPQHCGVAGGKEDSPVFSLPDLLVPPPPLLGAGVGGAWRPSRWRRTRSGSASGSAERHGSSWNCSG